MATYPTLTTRFAAGWLALLAWCGVCGCHLPAIDPTGQRIFSGDSTGLAHHELPGAGLFHHHGDRAPAAVPATPVCAPSPQEVPVIVGPVAVPQPIVPLPAPPPIAVPVQPAACNSPGQVQPTPLPPKIRVSGPVCQNASTNPAVRGPVLVVTPSRLVAPIGTEVLLAAGVTDGQGYYVLRQPLEWMLAQDGVGQVMAVGKESPLGASHVLRHSPQKVATNYVRAHTSTIEQTLDRGTPNPADDVRLERGQSWITVTSPTEGTSHITVWAPKEHNWDRRQTTATIHWVDARWQFPRCTAGRAGQRQLLETVIMRSDGAPLSGWLVRYEILGGPEAAFSARGETVAQIRTDGAGRATAELLPRSTVPGITTIGIQVIRPGSGPGDLPEMVVGQGTTAVNWSTPGLSVTAIGTGTVAADGAISYRVEVTNNGDLLTPGVVLSYSPPAGVTVLNSTPIAQVFGQRYQWTIGDLPARTTNVVELNCRASVAADVHSTFRAESSAGITAEGRATTRVFANALSVRMNSPDAVEVGREVQFLVDVTNTGSTTLTGVVASDTFDPGLAHTGGGASPLRRALDPIGPGETRQIALNFIVTQPGRQTHRLDVTADGGHLAGARGVVTGLPAAAPPSGPSVPGGSSPSTPAARPPVLEVKLSGPRSARQGQTADYSVEITNTGMTRATNVLVEVNHGINLELIAATRGYRHDSRALEVSWQIAEIPAGQTVRRQLQLRGINPEETGAIVRATAVANETRQSPQSGEWRTVILPSAAAPTPPVTTPPTTPAPAAGNLKVSIRDLADPIMIGGKTTFEIEVQNDRAVSDQDVLVTLELSAGLKVTTGRGPTEILSVSPDGRTIEMRPVREIRAGETLAPYQIEASGTAAGPQQARVTVKSIRTPGGVTATVETTVNPR
jgi:uncharacterized repeat protein (TIGR01451 family)